MSADRELLAATRLAAELEPTAQVHDGSAEYRVEVEAPGLAESDFQVEVLGRMLHVTGLDLRAPGSESTFEFLFRLPDDVDAAGLEAGFEAGRLVLRAAKGTSPQRPVEIDWDGPRTA